MLETFQPYYANVLNSVDGMPRIHIAYPVIAQLPASYNNKINTSIIGNNDIFKGVVAATIKPDSLVKLIGESLHRDFKNKIILYDRNGNVLYSSLQPSLVEKNIISIYGDTNRRTSAVNYNYNISSNNTNNNNDGASNSGEIFLGLFSSPEVRSLFGNVLYDSLKGGSGSRDFVISGTDTTYAYTPVLTEDNDGSNNNKHYFLTLSVVAPHYLRNEVGLLIQLQKISLLLQYQ